MSISWLLYVLCGGLSALLCVNSGILSVEELPASVHVVEDVYSYPWHIDTKYYTADVLLCTTNSRTIGDKSFAEAVQAFVVMFDSKEVWYIELSVVHIAFYVGSTLIENFFYYSCFVGYVIII